MPGENCSIFNYYSSRAAPQIRIPMKNDDKIKLEEENCCGYYLKNDDKIKLEEENCCSYYLCVVAIWKGKLKAEYCVLLDRSY